MRRLCRLIGPACLAWMVGPTGFGTSTRAEPAPSEEESHRTLVTAPAPRGTASETRRSPDALRAVPRRNAEELLREIPGLVLVQHGSEGKGHQFFLRGFDAMHGVDLEVTLGGTPLNEWSNVHAQGYLDLALIIPEFVRSLTVDKGPFGLHQGAFANAGTATWALGVTPGEEGWQVGVTLGTTYRQRLLAGWSPEGGDGVDFIGVEVVRDEGFGENRGLERVTLNAQAELLSDPDAGTLTLTLAASHGAFELPGLLRNDDIAAGRVGFFDTYDPAGQGMSTRALMKLEHRLDHAGGLFEASAHLGLRSLSLLENFTGFLIDPEGGDRRAQRHGSVSFGLSAADERVLAQPLRLVLGAGLIGDQLSQDEASVDQALERGAPRRDLRALQLLGHLRAGLRWSPSDAVSVDAGGRLDVAGVHVRDRLEGQRGAGLVATLSPRLIARWRPMPALALSVAYGRGFRPPEARAFTAFDAGRSGIGDEVLTGATPAMSLSDSVELAARWRPTRTVQVGAATFATFIARESIFDHVGGVSLDLNATRRLGAELTASWAPLPWLELGGDLTLVDARFSGSGARIPLVPWLTGVLRAMALHPSGLRAGLRAIALAPRHLPHGARGASFLRVDATLGWRWRSVDLALEVENLLDSRLREGEYHFASRWGPEAGQLPALQTAAGPLLNLRLTLRLFL